MKDNESFKGLVLKYFSFLETELGFKLALRNKDRLIYHSDKTQVFIDLDRTQALITLGPKDGSWSCDITELVFFSDQSLNFKYSQNPDGSIEPELKKLAAALKTHCSTFLAGDCSERAEIKKVVKENWNY